MRTSPLTALVMVWCLHRRRVNGQVRARRRPESAWSSPRLGCGQTRAPGTSCCRFAGWRTLSACCFCCFFVDFFCCGLFALVNRFHPEMAFADNDDGPVLMSGVPKRGGTDNRPSPDKTPERVRVEFPETWLWSDLSTGYRLPTADCFSVPHSLSVRPVHCQNRLRSSAATFRKIWRPG